MVITAVDPVVRVELLVPWDRERSIDTYVREQFELIDHVDTDGAMAAFRQLLAAQLPREIPKGWSFTPEADRPIGERHANELSIHVEAEMPGRTLFALQAQDVGNEENVACSELLELEVTEDLEILVRFDSEAAGATPAGASA